MQIINPSGGSGTTSAIQAPAVLTCVEDQWGVEIRPPEWTSSTREWSAHIGHTNRNPQPDAPTLRQDRYYCIFAYNIAKNGTGELEHDPNEVGFSVRFEDYWWVQGGFFLNFVSGAKFSTISSFSGGKTTLTLDTSSGAAAETASMTNSTRFDRRYVNSWVKFNTSGNKYKITDVDSPTQIKVEGNASAESTASTINTFTELNEFHTVFKPIGDSWLRVEAHQWHRNTRGFITHYINEWPCWFDAYNAPLLELKSEIYNGQGCVGTCSGSPTYNAGPNDTTITVGQAQLHSGMVGGFFRVIVNNTVYRFPIKSVGSTTQVTVHGNATTVATNGTAFRIVGANDLNIHNGRLILGNNSGGIAIRTQDPMSALTYQCMNLNRSNYLTIGNNNLYGCQIYGGATDGLVLGNAGTQKMGFFGQVGQARTTGWAVTNPVTRKTFDTTTVTLPQLAEVVGTIINTFHQSGGLGLLGT